MRFAPGTLFVFLGAAAWSGAGPSPSQGAAIPASPSPSPGATPSPAPRYKLLPYGFENPQARSAVPLLRFEDKAEVRALEMNAAIARFFEKTDEEGNMLRGATPGGAPPLRELGPYRPHVTPGLNLLGAVMLATQEIKKRAELHKGMPAAETSPSPSK